MICHADSCGASNPDDAQFCNRCGTRLILTSSTSRCKMCWKVVSDDILFCNFCGSTLSTTMIGLSIDQTDRWRNIFFDVIRCMMVPRADEGPAWRLWDRRGYGLHETVRVLKDLGYPWPDSARDEPWLMMFSNYGSYPVSLVARLAPGSHEIVEEVRGNVKARLTALRRIHLFVGATRCRIAVVEVRERGAFMARWEARVMANLRFQEIEEYRVRKTDLWLKPQGSNWLVVRWQTPSFPQRTVSDALAVFSAESSADSTRVGHEVEQRKRAEAQIERTARGEFSELLRQLGSEIVNVAHTFPISSD